MTSALIRQFLEDKTFQAEALLQDDSSVSARKKCAAVIRIDFARNIILGH